MKLLVIICCLCSWGTINAKPLFEEPISQHYRVIKNDAISESSGLAYSLTHSNILWTHNDSGHGAVVYAMNDHGEDFGEFALKGHPFDWEDMASFIFNEQAYLLFADTGDNYKFRRQYIISIYNEPDLDASRSKEQPAVQDLIFSFPNNKAYDVEAVAVDTQSQVILLATKHKNKTIIYSLPLDLELKTSPDSPIYAEKIRKIKSIEKVTSMDISRDAKAVVILVYGYIYYYEVKQGDSWRKTFKQKPRLIKYKPLFQPEAISFGDNNKEVFITSEKRQHLVKLTLK